MVLIFATLNSNAQFDHNVLNRSEIFLIREDSINKRAQRIAISNLKDIKQAESLFGKFYTSTKYFSELFNDNFIRLAYPDGLQLSFSLENHAIHTFNVTSNKYCLCFSDNKVIQVGMSLNDLSNLFPKSISQSKTYIDQKTKETKIAFSVFLSFTNKNKEVIEDSWITFLIHNQNKTLERFYLYVPG